MPDVIFIAVTLAFFALCALYARACDAIVRSTDTEAADAADGCPTARP